MSEDRPKLIYPGIRNGTLPPIPELQEWATSDPALLPVAHSYTEADLAAAQAATECHASQFSDAVRQALVPLFHQTIWQGSVHFRRALPETAEPSVGTPG